MNKSRISILIGSALIVMATTSGCTTLMNSYGKPAAPVAGPVQVSGTAEETDPTAEPEVVIPDAPTAEAAADCSAATTLRDMLACVTVAEPDAAAPKYQRDEFGDGWVDADGNGCDTRNDVLARDLTETVIDAKCRVQSGVLYDTYTGSVIQFTRGEKTSQAVQIDHIFSLHDAWYAGASSWTYDERVAFANDPANLLAADGSANSAKGSSGPAQYLPKENVCGYATSYTHSAYAYHLTVTPADYAKLAEVAAGC